VIGSAARPGDAGRAAVRAARDIAVTRHAIPFGVTHHGTGASAMRAIISAGLMLTATAALAEERRLDGGEIERLLKRNTVFGDHDGGRFRHYFAENGKTSLNPPGAAERVGDWRIDRQADTLELRWRKGGDWVPVTVYLDGKTVRMDYQDGPTRTGTVMNARGLE
jgi:hypothetical protein